MKQAPAVIAAVESARPDSEKKRRIPGARTPGIFSFVRQRPSAALMSAARAPSRVARTDNKRSHLTNRMREIRTSRSVGALGEQSPGAT